eukprot:CAMPEP_0194335224 /NCGR_PEP_ID=MMETSP0171-20130528/68840_1 /TAXON_ID=218684 /ORGANISM="Corethron pennatum, Strain L29A3" /LENGTH=114 /DNA_ID=CAMNT_0039098211 /DNA_START=120 /DNA_END=461 /DNA_ORIENTATION=+
MDLRDPSPLPSIAPAVGTSIPPMPFHVPPLLPPVAALPLPSLGMTAAASLDGVGGSSSASTSFQDALGVPRLPMPFSLSSFLSPGTASAPLRLSAAVPRLPAARPASSPPSPEA